MIVRIGDKGAHVKQIQKALDGAGFWNEGQAYTQHFGTITDKAVRAFQEAKGLVIDGRVGPNTLKLLGVTAKPQTKFDEKYKNVTIKGAELPNKPIKNNVKVRFNKEIIYEYLPALNSELSNEPLGLRLLCTVMAYKEGYRVGTRSYKHNNPGNIGNTDSGANKHLETIEEGVRLQRDYIKKVATGQHSAFPMGKKKILPPYYSPEIAKHSKLYGLSPYVPGYEFIFTGQLCQFIKIYATGPRASNSYLDMIVSYYKLKGIEITQNTTLQDIINIR